MNRFTMKAVREYFANQMVFLIVALIWPQVVLAEPLGLSKTDSIGEEECALIDKPIIYTICYGNQSNTFDVGEVILTDELPKTTVFVSADDGGIYDAATHSVTWNIGTLAAGAEMTCLKMIIDVNALPGQTLTNQVTIQGSEVSTFAAAQKVTEICPVAVNVDIKPGGCPTPVNVGSKGVLPVAVLGTSAFDVKSIDPISITLEGVAPLRWSFEDVATPYTINYESCDIMDCHEVGGDGIVDLTLKFETQAVAIAIGDVYYRECLIMELTGNLKAGYGGLPFSGGDVVSILKKKRPIVVPSNSLLLKP